MLFAANHNHYIGQVGCMNLPLPLPCWLTNGMFWNNQTKRHYISQMCRHTIHAFTCSTNNAISFSLRPMPCYCLLNGCKLIIVIAPFCVSRFLWQSRDTRVNADRGLNVTAWLRDSSRKTKLYGRDAAWLSVRITLSFWNSTGATRVSHLLNFRTIRKLSWLGGFAIFVDKASHCLVNRGLYMHVL